MQYSLSLLAAAFLAGIASAQNPFSFTTLTTVTAGTPFNITWSPSTGTTDTITLLLRQGDPAHLTTVATIASSIQNTGFYLWTPSTSLVQGSDYAFEIIDDGNTNIVNYSGQFTLNSPNTVSVATQSSTASSSATGSTASGSTTNTGGSSSSSKTGSTSTTAGSSTTGTSSTGTSTTTSKTSTSTASVPTTSGNAAAVGVEVKVGGSLLVLLGAVMAAL